MSAAQLHRHLPRLQPAAYQGRQLIHWTLSLSRREQGWLTPAFHAAFREILLQLALRHPVVVPAYCLMPDHLHNRVAGSD